MATLTKKMTKEEIIQLKNRLTREFDTPFHNRS